MNIEIANRLVQLRKKCGYSQEELASKLGLSRQSVSKWERAEASPDTDNLIELARLYNVSLDDLLNPEVNLDDVVNKAEKNPNEGSDVDATQHIEDDKDSTVNIGKDGIHITDGDDYVHIDGSGIHISENGKEKTVSNEDIKAKFKHEDHFVEEIATAIFGTIVIVGYLLFGFLYSDSAFAWKIGWTAILLIPVFGSIFECARKHRVSRFAYPVFCAAVYCFLSILFNLWHPLWVIFITIPLFYGIANPIDKVLKKKYPKVSGEGSKIVVDAQVD